MRRANRVCGQTATNRRQLIKVQIVKGLEQDRSTSRAIRNIKPALFKNRARGVKNNLAITEAGWRGDHQIIQFNRAGGRAVGDVEVLT